MLKKIVLNRKRNLHLMMGPVLFALCVIALPSDIFISASSRAAIGTVAWMAYWWVTAPVDYAVTAFMPIVVNALFPMAEMSAVISNYASETIILLLGASILTVTWEETGLDRRIASKFLALVGNTFRTQLIFWFIAAAFLSAILPNAVVCATLTPIAVAMLRFIGEEDIRKSEKGSKLLLYIAYGTGVGGLATPLGGAMNLVTVDYLQQITGEEYMYTAWVVRFLPIFLVLIISNVFFMLRNVDSNETMGASREFFQAEASQMKKISAEELCSLIMFLIATLLSFTRQLYQDILPGLKPAYVFITCAVVSFLLTDRKGERFVVWKSVQTKIVWELMYIFAGGLAAGTLINKSGAADAIGNAMSAMNFDNEFLTVLIIVSVTLLLSDVTSNTATAAVVMPIVISVIQGIGKNPIPYMYIASIGVNLSYMLPTSIRAIPVGYGLEPKYMFKEGWKLSLLVIGIMTLLSWCLLRYWSIFSTV